MDHHTRGQILGYIQSEPGTHYNELKKNLELNNGTLSYHLRVLEREGHIKSLNRGIYKFLFPGNFRLPNKFFKMNEIQKAFSNATEAQVIVDIALWLRQTGLKDEAYVKRKVIFCFGEKIIIVNLK